LPVAITQGNAGPDVEFNQTIDVSSAAAVVNSNQVAVARMRHNVSSEPIAPKQRQM